MNLLYLHAHDAGRYISPFGHNVPTPHLMNLAREGTLFRQAYCAAPTCSPSRAALLTGVTPHQSGMLGLAHRGFELSNPERHLAAFLGRNDFETALFGVQHEFNSDRNSLPYSIYEKPQLNFDEKTAQLAADYLNQPKDRPFFLSTGFFFPHREFVSAEGDVNPAYVKPPAPLPDNAQTRQDMANYMATVEIMDRCAGQVLDALKESGHERDTLVIFTVDHGIAFPRMKCNLHDTGIGVSLIIKYPGNPTAGRASDALVSHLDLYPTICDFLGLDPPEWLQGHSMVSLLDGTSEKIRDDVFAEVTYHAAYEPMRCIRTERYKLIKIFDDNLSPVPANMDDSPSKSCLVTAGLLDSPREAIQLYDLVLDPNEGNNLANLLAHQPILEELTTRLETWMRETCDPLLFGPVPKPKGARVNTRNSLSPRDPVG